MSGEAATTTTTTTKDDEPVFDRTKLSTTTGKPEQKSAPSPLNNKVPPSSSASTSSSSGSGGGSTSSDKFSSGGSGGPFFSSNERRSKSKSPQDIKDQFFQDFYERRKNRPRLSERLFNTKDRPSIFSDGGFIDDLRKELEKDKKMFWGDGVDPFGSHFPRGSSPGPQPHTNGSAAGSGSPRMNRVSYKLYWTSCFFSVVI